MSAARRRRIRARHSQSGPVDSPFGRATPLYDSYFASCTFVLRLMHAHMYSRPSSSNCPKTAPRPSLLKSVQVVLSYVIARFGAPAEILTDNGTEFEGEFDELLRQCFIDHRLTSAGHPQADGAAERIVQVLKAALRKHCEAEKNVHTWDRALPWIALGYRTSPQRSTGFSPYELMYGVAAVVPPATRERMDQELDFDSPDACVELMLARAELQRQRCVEAGGNLLIAQHRDTQRYAKVRTGRYQARPISIAPGDYVYIKRGQMANTLQMPQREEVLRVESAGELGVAVLIGRDGQRARRRVEQLVPCHLPDIDPIVTPQLARPLADLSCEVCGLPHSEESMLLCDACGTGWHMSCLTPPLLYVPEGTWVCPGCVKAQREAPALPPPVNPEAARLLFPNKATRKRDVDAESLHGMKVQRVERRKEGRRVVEVPCLGTLQFLGALARPKYFLVEWEGGQRGAEELSLAEAKRLLVQRR